MPDGYSAVTPYLLVHGAERLLDYLAAAFGAPAPGEMVSIFAGIGLEGPFWDPAADSWSGG